MRRTTLLPTLAALLALGCSPSSSEDTSDASTSGSTSDDASTGVCDDCHETSSGELEDTLDPETTGDGTTTSDGTTTGDLESCDGDPEGTVRACGSGVGVCVGKQYCINGAWTDCDAPAPADEVCDLANVDENCDGQSNEGCSCVPGDIEACNQEGDCAGSQRVCGADATWGDCSLLPTTEVCGGGDEDCDGEANEGCDCDPGDTQVGDCPVLGDCAGNVQVCGEDGTWGACTLSPGVEVCGGGDEDCDGATDEGEMGSTWYADLDGDNWYDPDVSVVACSAPEGYIAVDDAGGQDCEDLNEHLWSSCVFPLSGTAQHSCPLPIPQQTYHDCPDHFDLESSTSTLLFPGGNYSVDEVTWDDTRGNGYVRVTQSCNGSQFTIVQTSVTCRAHQYE
jgi:hypothetical protein